jgi:threonine dehydrogenase-like Zn-dependent dehydrogenase
VYGCSALPGCQAEYFVQPLADGSLFKVPEELTRDGFKLETLLLLADVLPTGYSAAFNARRLLVR